MKNRYGLIGFPLSHSFSENYFANKFEKEGIADHQYDLFSLKSIEEIIDILGTIENLKGLNVTIPYKEKVISYLYDISKKAAEVGAVNTIKIVDGKLIGYNTDVDGFEISLLKFLDRKKVKALVLGTGGASKAIQYVLRKNKIEYKVVSRDLLKGDLIYKNLNAKVFDNHHLILNTTPLGTFPKKEFCPKIPYEFLTSEHYLYDLVYNPEKTLFLQRGEERGAKIKNGLEMLELQAEKAWEIWKN